MKMKAYVSPRTKVLMLHTEGVVAASLRSNGGTNVDLDEKSKHTDSYKSSIWNSNKD